LTTAIGSLYKIGPYHTQVKIRKAAVQAKLAPKQNMHFVFFSKSNLDSRMDQPYEEKCVNKPWVDRF
jgi:hypothetical protein